MAHQVRSRRLVAGAFLLQCFAGLVMVPLSSAPSRAAENYVIPESDGYGIGDCMHAGMDCGRVIADSWCESHGHAHVLAFGTVADVTGSIEASIKPEPIAAANGDIVIRCGD